MGDVWGTSYIAGHPAGGIDDCVAARLKPAPSPIVTFHACARMKGQALTQRRGERSDVRLAIVRMDDLPPVELPCLITSNTEEIQVDPIYELHAAGRVRHPDHNRRTVGHRAEAFLVFSQLFFRPFGFCNVNDKLNTLIAAEPCC